MLYRLTSKTSYFLADVDVLGAWSGASPVASVCQPYPPQDLLPVVGQGMLVLAVNDTGMGGVPADSDARDCRRQRRDCETL